MDKNYKNLIGGIALSKTSHGAHGCVVVGVAQYMREIYILCIHPQRGYLQNINNSSGWEILAGISSHPRLFKTHLDWYEVVNRNCPRAKPYLKEEYYEN